MIVAVFNYLYHPIMGRLMGIGEFGEVQVLVSLDGLEDLHNEIRGQPFAFRSALETIGQIARSRKEWGVELAVNQTIVDVRGIEQYDAIHDLLGGMGVPHHVVVAYKESATYSTHASTDLSPKIGGAFRTANPIDPDVFRSFMDRVDKDARDLPWANGMAKAYYLKGIRNRVLHGRGVPNPSCAALAGHMRIFPNGDVPTCQFNSQVVGNLLTTDFDTCWNSAKALKNREWVERCPGCWAECEVLPSAVLGGDIVSHRFRMAVPA